MGEPGRNINKEGVPARPYMGRREGGAPPLFIFRTICGLALLNIY